MTYTLHHGDCLDILPTLPSASFDAIITDPPYPCIKREYGMMTEAAWLDMMRTLVPELRRVLKPSGSCVMVLQPNSEKVGRMRTWLWEFMAWVGKEWGIVQDAYWWNKCAPPTVHTQRERGLMRPSLKTCLWIGDADCYRNQSVVLLPPSKATMHDKRVNETTLVYQPSGHHGRRGKALSTWKERGGVTPFNIVSIANGDAFGSAGAHGHGAGTPLELCRWWTRYICPPGGAILDPFCGSGTTGIAALEHGCEYVGIERYTKYVPIAEGRLAGAASNQQLRMAV
jgi:DNA modification methylase